MVQQLSLFGARLVLVLHNSWLPIPSHRIPISSHGLGNAAGIEPVAQQDSRRKKNRGPDDKVGGRAIYKVRMDEAWGTWDTVLVTFVSRRAGAVIGQAPTSSLHICLPFSDLRSWRFSIAGHGTVLLTSSVPQLGITKIELIASRNISPGPQSVSCHTACGA